VIGDNTTIFSGTNGGGGVDIEHYSIM
jgi:hypothetical protein